MNNDSMKDITGLRFGRLVVLSQSGKNHRGAILWKCKCDCGNIVEVVKASLVRGATRSCGCLKKEVSARNVKKLATVNTKDLTGQRFGDLTVMGRDLDIHKKKIYWKCVCDCGKQTSVVGSSLVEGRTKSCGCVLDARKKTFYKNKEPYLFEGTSICNINNPQTIPKNNTTGVRGVKRHQCGKFQAEIKFKGKYHYLGLFNTLEEARTARKEAEKKYFNPAVEEFERRCH